MRPWQRFLLMHSGKAWLLVTALWVLAVAGHAGRIWRLPGMVLPLVFASVVVMVVVPAWARWRREQLIRESPIPQFLKRKLCETYPHLSRKDAELVERGLRQFFMACLRSRQKFVAMPSRAVDVMWHEFILHTRAYRNWCDLSLGHFLHHTPAEALGSRAKSNDGLRRAWYWSCRDEAIKPADPTRLPLLFALDTKLNIEGGFRYLPNCLLFRKEAGNDTGAAAHCGTDFSDNSYSGDADGFGGSDAGTDAGGSGDGGSGDGCGGGCGGD